ncbi:MAG: alpha/beta fold hydrolase [Spirochaetaceae bacterium]|nr:alpha/beta fold hydrolase [Spirochaetaceae bacterium]
MKKRRKAMIIILISIAGLTLSFLAGIIITRNFVYTPPFIDAEGKILSGSISEFRRVEIGGYSQAILIRGSSVENPVLLYLHAGPGMSEMGLFRNMHSELEDHYTVVHWDQRGTGKSYSPFLDSETLTVDQMVQDTHELTLYLKKVLGKEKIILMGHSWGTGLGVLTASKYPDDYLAYIGMAQVVNVEKSDKMSYLAAMECARSEGNDKAVNDLEQIDGFWSKRDKNYMSNMMKMKKWVFYYGGCLSGHKNLSMVMGNILSRECTIFDYPALLLGSNFSLKTMAANISYFDAMKEIPVLNVPFFLLEGRQDKNSMSSLAEEYFNFVSAPQKELFWFNNSAHWPNLEERDKFHSIMINQIGPMINYQGELLASHK